MARFESQAVAGYYPTPQRLLPHLARLVDWQGRDGWCSPRYVLLDPCAGDGEAIHTLRSLWPQIEEPPEIAACEMEASRAKALRSRLPFRDQVLHADAFRVTWRQGDKGASLLFLNPPYDQDPDFGRLEERFLDRFQQARQPLQAPTQHLPATRQRCHIVERGLVRNPRVAALTPRTGPDTAPAAPGRSPRALPDRPRCPAASG
jgi:hypothetical protein